MVEKFANCKSCLGLPIAVFVCLTLVRMDECPADQPIEQCGYSHVVFDRFVRGEDGSLATEVCYELVPGAGLADADRELPMPSDERGQTLAVDDHAVYFSIQGDNIERVNLQDSTNRKYYPGTGQSRFSLGYSSVGDYFSSSPAALNQVFLYDTQLQSRQLLVDRSEKVAPLLGGIRYADSVFSPDGKLLATATYEDGGADPIFAIKVFELRRAAESKIIFSGSVPGELLSTGAGTPVAAPAMIWDDEQTLLLLVPKPPVYQDQEQRVRLLDVASDEVTHSLLQVDVKSQSQKTICDLRLSAMIGLFYAPSFWKPTGGTLMLEAPTGRWEIDTAGGNASLTRKIASNYEFRGDARFPSLWYRDQELAAKVNPAFVSLSPDGKQIAWCVPVNPLQLLSFQSLQFDQILNYHSEATGTTKLTEGAFHDSAYGFRTRTPLACGWLDWVPSER